MAGEGASSRNSGYLVDTTLNDGFTSNKELDNYKKKTDIYDLGINSVKKFINEYQVDCDWNECGKYFASSKIEDEKILINFSNTLSKLNFKHNLLSHNELSKTLGIGCLIATHNIDLANIMDRCITLENGSLKY